MFAGLVTLLYIVKGALLLTRYAHRFYCKDDDPVTDDDSLELQKNISHSYYVTYSVYVICSIARCIEYIPLFIGLYKFYKYSVLDHSLHNLWCYGPFTCPSCNSSTFLSTLFLLALFVLAWSIPSVGKTAEIIHGKKKLCIDDISIVYYIYCALNYLRYAWDFSVRVGIILATLKVKEIWRNAASAMSSYQLTAVQQHTIQGNPIVAQHAQLTNEYMQAGQEVQKITNIFETWFLFPWIIFFLASSLEAKDILSVWNKDREEVEVLPMMYFILYNINQMVFLLIPYICAQKMNYYHHKCHVRIHEAQLVLSMSDDNLLQQRKLLIEEEHDYNFVPRFWGLGFKVRMNSIIYIIFLLLGLVFTICRPML